MRLTYLGVPKSEGGPFPIINLVLEIPPNSSGKYVGCIKIKKWGNGSQGDKRARWRLHRGANKGQLNSKAFKAKVAK